MPSVAWRREPASCWARFLNSYPGLGSAEYKDEWTEVSALEPTGSVSGASSHLWGNQLLQCSCTWKDQNKADKLRWHFYLVGFFAGSPGLSCTILLKYTFMASRELNTTGEAGTPCEETR